MCGVFLACEDSAECSTNYSLPAFFFKWTSARADQFHSLGQNQSTVAISVCFTYPVSVSSQDVLHALPDGEVLVQHHGVGLVLEDGRVVVAHDEDGHVGLRYLRGEGRVVGLYTKLKPDSKTEFEWTVIGTLCTECDNRNGEEWFQSNNGDVQLS